MSVFVWSPKVLDPNLMPSDEFQTSWYCDAPSCIFCGQQLERGQRVLAWQADRTFHAHAACVKANGRGLMKDIAECLQ